MIQFEKFTLDNGLRVIVHQDLSTPMAVMNIMNAIQNFGQSKGYGGNNNDLKEEVHVCLFQ